MLDSMCMALEKPPLYKKSEGAFWNDEYISKQMLKAHLDPQFEGASRKLDFIERSVAWMKELVAPICYPTLLDIGCGPGIYAERFTKEGYQVTGIDFSKRSIDYSVRMGTMPARMSTCPMTVPCSRVRLQRFPLGLGLKCRTAMRAMCFRVPAWP